MEKDSTSGGGKVGEERGEWQWYLKGHYLQAQTARWCVQEEQGGLLCSIRTDVLEGEMAAGTVRAGGYGSVAERRDPLHLFQMGIKKKGSW